MKKSLTILGLSLMSLFSAAHAATVPSRYLDGNITRPYYMDELEHCPGILEMRPGDLWTITFPDEIRDSFITREGVIERQVVGNRLVMAAVGSSGNTPVLVMTNDAKAPRFRVEIKSGEGGQNKNIVVLPGLPVGGSQCPGTQQAVEYRSQANLPEETVAPALQAALPTVGTTASNGSETNPKSEGRTQAASNYLSVTLERSGINLKLLLSNTLDSDAVLSGKTLTIGGQSTSLSQTYIVPARGTLEVNVPTAANGELVWTGHLVSTGEAIEVIAAR